MRCLKKVLIVSILFNVLSCCCIAYCFYKTDFVVRISNKLGYYHNIPTRCDVDCVLGWTNTLKKLNLDVDVVFFGNSMTCDGNFQEYFPDKKVCNLGYPGDDMKGMIRRVEQITAVQPEKIFIMAGINGLKLQSLSDFERQYKFLIEKIQNENPSSELFIQSILPVGENSNFCDNYKIVEANCIIRQVAMDKKLCYIDLYSVYAKDGCLPADLTYDGIHLKSSAYKIWMEQIKRNINNK